jgi:ATP-binding cassette, subfamily C, type I secretion system permease/ATPase
MPNPRRGITTARSELGEALARCKSAFWGVGVISGLVNVLMLTGPLFMLQVYDRVLPSRSIPTLVGFVVLIIALFALQGVLDALRARVLQRIGAALDEALSGRVYQAIVRLPLKTDTGGNGLQPLRDLDQIRSFLAIGGPSAMFDLPWMPIYVAVCYLFHPLIGLAALSGALMLIVLMLAANAAMRKPAKEATSLASNRTALAEASRRNAEALTAMGMCSALGSRWQAINRDYLRIQQRTSDRASGLASLSRAARLLLQSVVLGLGAYLVIHQEASAGIIIASSILVSRALAPVELAIANWKGFTAARQSWRRLTELLAFLPSAEERLALPRPQASLSVQNVSACPPGDPRIVVDSVTFTLEAGAGLGVIGPSAAGKSSLARTLVGVWQPTRGKVRLDAAALEQWSPDLLGPHIGYLPQDVELLEGTVAENIGRFGAELDAEAIIAAAKAAGVHELILALPEGYQTKIGEGGSALSAGQRQRVALARALYGDPFLVVLDEPNSNLDADGEEALTNAIMNVRMRGGIAVVIAHRPSAIAAVDQILVMAHGKQQAFGPKEQVLRSTLRTAAPLSVAQEQAAS